MLSRCTHVRHSRWWCGTRGKGLAVRRKVGGIRGQSPMEHRSGVSVPLIAVGRMEWLKPPVMASIRVWIGGLGHGIRTGSCQGRVKRCGGGVDTAPTLRTYRTLFPALPVRVGVVRSLHTTKPLIGGVQNTSLCEIVGECRNLGVSAWGCYE